jgi:hypothetical protein
LIVEHLLLFDNGGHHLRRCLVLENEHGWSKVLKEKKKRNIKNYSKGQLKK